MEQFKFDFGKLEDHPVSTRLRQIEKHSEVYLINAPNGELITIGHNNQLKPYKIGESYVA